MWSQRNRFFWPHKHFHLHLLFHGLTALVGMWLLNCEVSLSHSDTHIQYDSYGWVIGPMQRPLTEITQHSQETDIHAPVGIWTQNPIKRVAADPHLRSSDHRDRLSLPLVFLNYENTVSLGAGWILFYKFCIYCFYWDTNIMCCNRKSRDIMWTFY